MHHLPGVTCASEAGPMNINQAKWFLRVFANGKKLNTLTIRDLYLSGYLGIELRSPGKEPLPTVITEKGKRVLETYKPWVRSVREGSVPIPVEK